VVRHLAGPRYGLDVSQRVLFFEGATFMSSCVKIRYFQRRDAVAALRIIAKKCRRKGKKVPVAIYPCEHCGAWHLTSKVTHRTPTELGGAVDAWRAEVSSPASSVARSAKPALR